MPYKERLRNQGKSSQKKSNYQVTNWSASNQALKNRGDLVLSHLLRVNLNGDKLGQKS